MRVLSVLLLMCAIRICALSQGSSMISISDLRQESEVALAYNRADVKRLMRSAQTAVEFGQLAAYFDRQADMYAARYEAEEKEVYRLLALPYHARSYPMQVESTRNRIDHFKSLSHKCSEQAAMFRARAKDDGGAGAVAAPPS